MQKALYESVTAAIIKDLESGVASWIKPWTTKGGGIMPRNYASKRRYSGINVLVLWDNRPRNLRGQLCRCFELESCSQKNDGRSSRRVCKHRAILL